MSELVQSYGKLERLEKAIKQHLAPVELVVKDHFSKGLYARELRIPAGTVLTGEIHKHQNLNIMSQGAMTVVTAEGMLHVRAPYTVVSPPGTKRAAYAHEDTVWTTIHATDETDVDKIRAEFVVSTLDEYLAYCEQLKLKGPE